MNEAITLFPLMHERLYAAVAPFSGNDGLQRTDRCGASKDA